jgi:hypothetical protein
LFGKSSPSDSCIPVYSNKYVAPNHVFPGVHCPHIGDGNS